MILKETATVKMSAVRHIPNKSGLKLSVTSRRTRLGQNQVLLKIASYEIPTDVTTQRNDT